MSIRKKLRARQRLLQKRSIQYAAALRSGMLPRRGVITHQPNSAKNAAIFDYDTIGRERHRLNELNDQATSSPTPHAAR